MFVLKILLFLTAFYSYRAHRNVRDFKKCCSLPKIITADIEEQCQDHARNKGSSCDSGDSTESPPCRPPPQKHCFMACFLNVTQIIDENGKFYEENLENHLRVALQGKDDIKPLFWEAFVNCYEQIKFERERAKESNRIPPPIPSHDHCHPRNGHLMRCVFKRTFVNCPEDLWLETEECTNLRRRMNNRESLTLS